MRPLTYVGIFLILAWLTSIGVGLCRGWEKLKQPIQPIKPDTVYMPPDTVRVLVERYVNPKPPTITERILTREVPPDTVYIARVDTVTFPLPTWGMLQVDKEDLALTVTSLTWSGKEVQVQKLTLPKEDTNYRLTAGATAGTLRVARTWEVIDWKVEALVMAGEGGVDAAVIGPVGVRATPNMTIAPVLGVGEAGLKLGVALEF